MEQTERGAAIVTGASRGIGAAVARKLSRDGYRVAIAYASGAMAAVQVRNELKNAIAVQCDIASEADVMRLFRTAEASLGPVRALVNNAGITGGMTRVESVDSATLTRLFAVNVTGAFLCAREAVKRMSTRNGGPGGAIVNISSRAAKTGGAGDWVHYAASKGAIDTFTVGLARETAAEGIRVNAVAPGLIETEIHAAAGAPHRLKELSPSIPMKRPGSADEVANAVAWLLSDEASYVTGTILEVGGGR